MAEWKEIKGTDGGSYPDTWDFEDKDTIVGRYKSKRENVGPNESTVYTIVTEDGEYAVWGSKILNDKMSEVQLGEMVRIKFVGWGESESSGRTWKDYRVASREATDEDAESVSSEDESEKENEDISPDEIPF